MVLRLEPIWEKGLHFFRCLSSEGLGESKHADRQTHLTLYNPMYFSLSHLSKRLWKVRGVAALRTTEKNLSFGLSWQPTRLAIKYQRGGVRQVYKVRAWREGKGKPRWVRHTKLCLSDRTGAWCSFRAPCLPLKQQQQQKTQLYRDFPGGTLVKILNFQCRAHGFDPWSGNKNATCHKAWPINKQTKKLFISVYSWGFSQDLGS